MSMWLLLTSKIYRLLFSVEWAGLIDTWVSSLYLTMGLCNILLK